MIQNKKHKSEEYKKKENLAMPIEDIAYETEFEIIVCFGRNKIKKKTKFEREIQRV